MLKPPLVLTFLGATADELEVVGEDEELRGTLDTIR